MAVLPPDPIFCLRSDMGHVHSMCFDEGEGDLCENLYACTESGFVYIWNLNRNRLKYKQHLGESIQAIHYVDNKLISQEKSGILKVWHHNEGNYVFSRKFDFLGGYCKSVLTDNKLILPQDKSSLDLVDLQHLESIRKYHPKENSVGNVMCIEMVTLSDKLYVFAGYESGMVILYDYETGVFCSELQLRECITSLTFDSLSLRGIVGNASNVLQIITIDRNFKITLKCEVNTTNEGCNVVKLRPDKKIFVSGGVDARLRIYSWKTLRTLVVLTDHKKSITDVQFSPKNVEVHKSKLMVCGGADGCISLWNIYN